MESSRSKKRNRDLYSFVPIRPSQSNSMWRSMYEADLTVSVISFITDMLRSQIRIILNKSNTMDSTSEAGTVYQSTRVLFRLLWSWSSNRVAQSWVFSVWFCRRLLKACLFVPFLLKIVLPVLQETLYKQIKKNRTQICFISKDVSTGWFLPYY
jgi:hypothetical protein